jgi:hypothetical protein
MSKPWPPPPDLESLKELVRDADTESFIEMGGPTDEYDGEAEQLYAKIGGFPTADLLAVNILPILERIWIKSFDLDERTLAISRPALVKLAQQIERFFGPSSQPQVRSNS